MVETFKLYLAHCLIWIFNSIYYLLEMFGMELIPLTPTAIAKKLHYKEKKEMLMEDFSIPLRYYLRGFESNKQTTGIRRYATIQKVRYFAAVRASVREEIIQNPDIANTPLNGPFLIIGPPRCGTTMLHRLLASDPQFLFPLFWEILNPLPPGRPENWKQSDRYKMAANNYFKEAVLNGYHGTQAFHEYSPDLAEECTFLLNPFFLAFVEPFTADSMSLWRDYLYTCPESHVLNAYEHYKRCMQCIFYKNVTKDKFILSKSPIHLLFLDKCRKIFPNAKFIFTYRKPREMIGSYCSLVRKFAKQIGFSDDQMGQRILEYYSIATSRAVRAFKSMPKDSFITIPYAEMVNDRLSTVKKIYQHFNLHLSPEVDHSIRAHMEDFPQHKYGRHDYDIESYGLTNEDLRNSLADYLNFFDGKYPEKLL